MPNVAPPPAPKAPMDQPGSGNGGGDFKQSLNALLAKGNPLAAPKPAPVYQPPVQEESKKPAKMTIFEDNDDDEDDGYALAPPKRPIAMTGASFIDNSASLLKPVQVAKAKPLPANKAKLLFGDSDDDEDY